MFCANDILAKWVLWTVLGKLDVKDIPQDFAVMGVDDIPQWPLGRFHDLTTIAQPTDNIVQKELSKT